MGPAETNIISPQNHTRNKSFQLYILKSSWNYHQIFQTHFLWQIGSVGILWHLIALIKFLEPLPLSWGRKRDNKKCFLQEEHISFWWCQQFSYELSNYECNTSHVKEPISIFHYDFTFSAILCNFFGLHLCSS